MEVLDIQEQANGLSFRVRVLPKAHRNAVVGVESGALVVRLVAPPVEGKANEALLDYLASCLGLRKRQIHLQSGQKSRHKIVLVEGVTREALKQLGSPESEE